MATGFARGAAARGKRTAFGDGKKIIWDKNSPEIFKGNPNIAPEGSESAQNLEWVGFYKGSRLYNKQGPGRWIWNYEFRPIRGEMFFDEQEKNNGRSGSGFVIIEPSVPLWKSVAPNKQWGRAKYQRVAEILRRNGFRVAQFGYGRSSPTLSSVATIRTRTFRDALSVLAYASLYVGPEGGLHHGAAAVGIPAVVLFGGFIPPQVTGYDTHTNLTGGAEACGSLALCQHCRDAMDRISVEEVAESALTYLRRAA